MNSNKIILELFSGSKTVSKIFEANGWQSFTVDYNSKLKPALCCDICTLDLKLLPGNVDFIWASPDCSKFSRAAKSAHWLKITNKYRQYSYLPQTPEAEKALSMLNSAVTIIKNYNSVPFIIENPIGRIHHTSALKNLGHYRYSVNYADFGFAYSKETYLFSNIWLPFSTKKVHSSMPGLRTVHSTFQRSIVPPELVQTIFDYCF